jgi:hypothetical protein
MESNPPIMKLAMTLVELQPSVEPQPRPRRIRIPAAMKNNAPIQSIRRSLAIAVSLSPALTGSL